MGAKPTPNDRSHGRISSPGLLDCRDMSELESEDSWLDDFREETDDELGEAPPGFLLDELLGRGGMAEVYLAHRTGPKGFSRKVVIKRIRPDKVHDRDFVDRFIREASLTSKFHHPNIVEILELVTLDDTYFIVMEYLNGKPINSIVDVLNKTRRHFPQDLAAFTVAGLASAIAYAHNFIDGDGKRHQIVHRDISPDNVFITYGGEVKLLDFGVAKDLDGTQMTQGDQVIGKPLYLPPESLHGAPATPARDVYSLGMTLYVMLAGRPPYDVSNGPEGLAKLLMDITGGAEAPPPSTFNPDIDPDLEYIVMKTIAPDPKARYSAADLKSVLEGWVMGAGTTVSATQLAEFVREVGGSPELSRSSGPQKPLKAIGGTPKAKGGWQANRESAPLPSGKPIPDVPMQELKPGGTQILDGESVVKPLGQPSTLLLDDSLGSPGLEQRTSSHPSAEIDPRTLESGPSQELPPIDPPPPRAKPEKKQRDSSPFKPIAAFEVDGGAFAPAPKRRAPKRRAQPRAKAKPRQELDRGKQAIGALFLLAVLGGAGAFAYSAMNPPGEDEHVLAEEIAKIKASLTDTLVEPTELPEITADAAEPAAAEPSEPEEEEALVPVTPPQARLTATLAVRCDGTWIYVDGAQRGSCGLSATRIRVTPGKHVVEVETVGGLLRGVVRARPNRETLVKLKKKRVKREVPDEVVRVGQ